MEHITNFICKQKIEQEILYIESYNTAIIFSILGITGLCYGIYNSYRFNNLKEMYKKKDVYKNNLADKIYMDLIDITDVNSNPNMNESESDDTDNESDDNEENIEDIDMEDVNL